MKIAKFSNNISTEYNRRTGMVNMGDSIISLAIENVLDIVGADKRDAIEIPLYGKHDVSEDCLLPVCGHFGRQYDMDFMNHSNLHPIFMGFGIKDEFLTENEIEYLKKYEPILCRDEFTKDVLRKHGIEAYLFGCITLLLPDRTDREHPDKIFFVDVKNRYKKFLPKEVLKEAVFLSQNMAYADTDKEDWKNESSYAKERLKRYAEEAKLVVTSKLHCMCPCMAMGIPTIALGENFSYRYGFIDAFVDAYNEDMIAEIDWNHISLNTVLKKRIKPLMTDIVQSVFNGTPDIEKIKQLDVFYSNRNRWDYFCEIGKKVKSFFGLDNSKDYIIWGASSGGYAMYAYICRTIKEANLVGIADSYAEGSFGGLKIRKPEEVLKTYPNTKIIVSTISGRESAEEYLNYIGKKENIDYVFLHESM